MRQLRLGGEAMTSDEILRVWLQSAKEREDL